ncbi:MAG: type IV pilus modification protein PilV [Halomonas sp.]|nr:type IV pilus modification protein PilV [Halomonas sp.]MCC5901597.1 type IV pilus modification protein PilV [Halomonas sp.]
MPQQSGFSLIEVLVALVILAFGLLGVAAMQLKSLQSASAGYQRSMASVAAIDAQELIWSLLANNPDCTAIDSGSVEEKWRDEWSRDTPSNPLREAHWNSSGISGPDPDCEFRVTIVLGASPDEDEPAVFEYYFRLPNFADNHQL